MKAPVLLRAACVASIVCASGTAGANAFGASVADGPHGAPAQAAAMTASGPSSGHPRVCASWARWERFRRDFVSKDGRVIDVGSADERTVSEGQSYALFFALVANDRASFDTILHWTEHELAQGDLASHLPAWLWGRDEAGQFRVLDANAASDADLWIAYALLEAGRAWGERSYTARGTLLAKRVLDEEAATLPGLGPTLLLGPAGFHFAADTWRVNPSYAPLQVIRGIGAHLPDDTRWPRLAATSARMLIDTAPRGFSPDWALYRAKGFAPDEQTQAESAYNAIRVYLWAGMLAADDDARTKLLERFAPFAAYIERHGAPPERVDTRTGTPGENDGNAGFSAAAVPFLAARGQSALADAQAARADHEAAPGYYTSVLMLFGLGWRERRFSFAADGTLHSAASECGAAR
jgi:endoglucanase